MLELRAKGPVFSGLAIDRWGCLVFEGARTDLLEKPNRAGEAGDFGAEESSHFSRRASR